MIQKLEHKGISGIYLIENLINNKIYIGKAKCIYKRIKQHITLLNTKSKDENSHMINSWHKYGRNNFDYKILEICDDLDKLSELELKWILFYINQNKKLIFNQRIDTSTGLIVSQETRNKMRISRYKALENPEIKKKCSHDYWKNNPDKLKQMSEKVARLNVKYFIDQYDKKTNEFIRRWDSIIELMENNPNYKKHNIYAVCSGEKPSIYGFIWKKILKN